MSAVSRPVALTPAAGPDAPRSSRAGVGLWDGPVHAYRAGSDDDDGDAAGVLGLPGGAAGPDSWIEVAVYPRDDGDPAAAPRRSGPAVREVRGGVVDGGWGVDQHGHELDDGPGCLVADQWNLLRLTPGPGDGVTGVDGVALTLPAGSPASGFVQVRAVPRVPLPGDPVDQVDTRRGTHSRHAHSRGNTTPMTCAPHGMAYLTPVTDVADVARPYFWHATHLEGMAFTTRPSPWIGGWPAAVLMPFHGEVPGSVAERRRVLDHDREAAGVHRYAADLGAGLTLEATATTRVALVRAAFPDDGRPGGILLDRPRAGDLRADRAPDGTVRVEIRAWLDGEATDPDPDGRWPRPRTVVVGRTSTPATVRDVGTGVALVADDGDHLELRLALSYLSAERAEHTLDLEVGAASFDAVLARSADTWGDLLGRLELDGSTEEETVTARTALARLHSWPSTADEDAGTPDAPRPVHAGLFRPREDGQPRSTMPELPGRLLLNTGYWDTYRTAWPAFALLTPSRVGALLDGALGQLRDGGWMARWAAPSYTDCMVGTSSDVVFADAVAHGVATSDWDEVLAYDGALRNATVPSDHAAHGRAGLGRARFVGWADTDTREGFSWSVEGAICDDALARWAADLAGRAGALGLAHRRDQWLADAWYLGQRALAVRGLFDPATGLHQGRRPDDEPAVPAAELDPGRWGGDFAETNAWGMSASTVHDGPGLAAAHGGERGLAAHLERLLATPEPATDAVRGHYPEVIHEMTEARSGDLGMLGLSNQPAHHLPYVFLHAGRPDRAQALVRECLDRLFTGGEIGQGHPGDEDNGEMSAWWLLSALGLYPLLPGSGEYVLVAPLFERAAWRRDDGTVLEVRTSRPDGVTRREARYVAGVRVDGEPWDRVAVPTSRLRGDVRIEVDLSDRPTDWGAGTRPAGSAVPPPDGVGWVADSSGAARVHPPGLASLVDDVGARVHALPAGEAVVLAWDRPVPLTHLTLTLDDAVDLTVEARTGEDGAWRELAGASLRPSWPDQTIPVLVGEPRPVVTRTGGPVVAGPEPVVVRALRVRVHGAARLRQLEAFGAVRSRLPVGPEVDPRTTSEGGVATR